MERFVPKKRKTHPPISDFSPIHCTLALFGAYELVRFKGLTIHVCADAPME